MFHRIGEPVDVGYSEREQEFFACVNVAFAVEPRNKRQTRGYPVGETSETSIFRFSVMVSELFPV